LNGRTDSPQTILHKGNTSHVEAYHSLGQFVKPRRFKSEVHKAPWRKPQPESGSSGFF